MVHKSLSQLVQKSSSQLVHKGQTNRQLQLVHKLSTKLMYESSN